MRRPFQRRKYSHQNLDIGLLKYPFGRPVSFHRLLGAALQGLFKARGNFGVTQVRRAQPEAFAFPDLRNGQRCNQQQARTQQLATLHFRAPLIRSDKACTHRPERKISSGYPAPGFGT